jgi:hypothetical protein
MIFPSLIVILEIISIFGGALPDCAHAHTASRNIVAKASEIAFFITTPFSAVVRFGAGAERARGACDAHSTSRAQPLSILAAVSMSQIVEGATHPAKSTAQVTRVIPNVFWSILYIQNSSNNE